jgi:hypothetical protein
LKYSDYIGDCAQTLAQVALAEADHLLPYFIRMQRIVEEAKNAFDYDGEVKMQQNDSIRIEMLARSYEQELQQIQETCPSEIWKNGMSA